MTREQMQSELRKGTVRVTFTKTDGSTRVMHATLQTEAIQRHFSARRQPTHQGNRNMNVLPVFDVDIDQWRSFRIDSVQEFTPVSLATC